MARMRANVIKGVNVIFEHNQPITGKCFEIYKVKTFKTLNEAQRFYKYLLLNVSERVYLYQYKTSYRVEFKDYTDNYEDAELLYHAISGHFDLWLVGR